MPPGGEAYGRDLQGGVTMRKIIITSIISVLLAAVAATFGVRHYTQASSPATVYDADINHDGWVNGLDLNNLARYFGA
jgi:hypothetical protein